MLSKAKLKFVQALKDKKQRSAQGLFVVEGNKNVAELLRSKIKVKLLFTTHEWQATAQETIHSETEHIKLEAGDMKKLSFSATPQDALAVAEIPELPGIASVQTSGFILALDTIQDPGNFGTIMRIADWYGIRQILYTPGCADPYGPKVIQSTMGSFTRVTIIESDLVSFFKAHPEIPVYGALLHGTSIYEQPVGEGVLLIGNEGHGLSKSLLPFINHPVTIPRIGGAESLNAAVATGILCDNYAAHRS